MDREQVTIADADVVREQYVDQTRLAARQALWRWLPGAPLTEIVLDLAALRGEETVVDIGCGNGTYLGALRRRGHGGPVVGFDLSQAMAVGVASAGGIAAIADAQHLPLPTASVDVAMSLHMLYHVPDVAAAVAELRRVVRPGGCALVATNGSGHAIEIKRILAQAASRVAGVDVDLEWDTRPFDTVGARQLLGAVFDQVEVSQPGVSFPVPDPDVVGDYVASWSPAVAGLRAGPVWDATVAEARALAAAHVAGHGVFEVTSRTAVLRCS